MANRSIVLSLLVHIIMFLHDYDRACHTSSTRYVSASFYVTQPSSVSVVWTMNTPVTAAWSYSHSRPAGQAWRIAMIEGGYVIWDYYTTSNSPHTFTLPILSRQPGAWQVFIGD